MRLCLGKQLFLLLSASNNHAMCYFVLLLLSVIFGFVMRAFINYHEAFDQHDHQISEKKFFQTPHYSTNFLL
ncbi:CLUMA_CG000473, isoform A [Clunio marinus]|uniref:CLUMA_CG000473, isoform A n=1 Tax=Clunio marinus TaxID=568069 RepID=A0A1J1HF53_9DIPT|nr:CLUMA_CG000473, isoform A [Clunio marinus]